MPTMTGIVIIESNVVKDTIVAESGVSPSNFSENIVVFAAVGADAAIMQAVRTTPLTSSIQSAKSKIKNGNRDLTGSLL